jgi:hypothetical protein
MLRCTCTPAHPCPTFLSRWNLFYPLSHLSITLESILSLESILFIIIRYQLFIFAWYETTRKVPTAYHTTISVSHLLHESYIYMLDASSGHLPGDHQITSMTKLYMALQTARTPPTPPAPISPHNSLSSLGRTLAMVTVLTIFTMAITAIVKNVAIYVFSKLKQVFTGSAADPPAFSTADSVDINEEALSTITSTTPAASELNSPGNSGV